MNKSQSCEKGKEARTEIHKWPADGTPTVLHYPPRAYRHIRADEVESFTKELQQRLGLESDLASASGGTVSFCERGGSGAAIRCDSDIDSTARPSADDNDLISDWNSQPTVLHFKPEAYAKVSPDELQDWVDEVKDRLGLELKPEGISMGTTSFCHVNNDTSSGYGCDCDFGVRPW